jgi:Mrp family chromosome partitioning ATPase
MLLNSVPICISSLINIQKGEIEYMKTIAFHIQKGGTGKTSLSGNVAYCSALKKKTVLIDADLMVY